MIKKVKGCVKDEPTYLIPIKKINKDISSIFLCV